MFSAADHQFMARALQLAAHGLLTTSPNPRVGCVLVSPEGHIVGEGWHERAGAEHAEINALHQMQRNKAHAKNCTAYIALEPCNHYGRTPPCVDALITVGIRKVIAAMLDPNPKVAGQGLARLQAIRHQHRLWSYDGRSTRTQPRVYLQDGTTTPLGSPQNSEQP